MNHRVKKLSLCSPAWGWAASAMPVSSRSQPGSAHMRHGPLEILWLVPTPTGTKPQGCIGPARGGFRPGAMPAPGGLRSSAAQALAAPLVVPANGRQSSATGTSCTPPSGVALLSLPLLLERLELRDEPRQAAQRLVHLDVLLHPHGGIAHHDPVRRHVRANAG